MFSRNAFNDSSQSGIKSAPAFIRRWFSNDDLAGLFKRELGTDYTKENYIEQFSIRIPNLLAKIGRVEEIYKAKVPDTPQIVYDVFNKQRERLNAAKGKLGECISPFDL